MKIILTPIGSSGDVHPFVGLALALRDRGHRVLVVTNDQFEPLIRAAGLDFQPLGTSRDYLSAISDRNIWHPIRGFGRIADLCGQLVRPLYDTVAREFEPGQTLVVAHSLALGARIAQDKLGVPVVTVHLAPAVFRSEYVAPVLPGMGVPAWAPRWYKRLTIWAADVLVIDRLMGPPVNRFRAELGLPPVRRLAHFWWNSPLLTLGLFPDWFGPPQPDWPSPLRLVGFPLYDERGTTAMPPGIEDFLAAGPPPIVFTPGSAMLHGHDFFAAAVGACQRLGRRGILLTRFPAQLPALPDTVRHFDFVPLSQLLPRAAAIVHHGGIGTTAQGLASGVPQMIMAMAHDQFDNAARVVRLGTGVVIKPSRFSVARVANALGPLLDSEAVAAACRQVKARFMGVDAIGAACDAIEGALPFSPRERVSVHARP